VNISFYGNDKVHDPAYYASKAGLDKLAAVYGEHFTPFNVVRDLSMAWVCCHGTHDTTHGDRSGRQAAQGEDGIREHRIERPRYRALYDDPNLLTLSGKTIITAEAAERYGISDLDGYEPKSLRGIYGGPHPDFDQ
jgi:hypothetical protein